MKYKIHIPLVIFILISVLFIVIGRQIFVTGIVSGFAQRLVSSPKSFLYNMKVQLFNGGVLTKNDTLDSLRAENRKLSEQMVDYMRLKNENSSMRTQFVQGVIRPEKLLQAHVVGFLGRFDSPSTLIIDRGSLDGVKKGTSVMYGKELVGIISKTSSNFSQVILPVNDSFSIVGKTSQSSATGVLTGEGEFVLFNNILITDTLHPGDIVVTKGNLDIQGNGIQPNLIVGKIVSINKIEDQPFQDAKVVNNIDYGRLDDVYISVLQ